MNIPLKHVEIYTDGACSGNPGPGGWGALMNFEGITKELWDGENPTTNNRMEMMAVIQSLESLKHPVKITLYTDSKYVLDGITKWIIGWKKNGWRDASNEPVKNSDLWQRLDQATKPHTIEWVWIKGHSGNPGNERADELARLGIQKGLKID
jgi:ribonuclease HI